VSLDAAPADSCGPFARPARRHADLAVGADHFDKDSLAAPRTALHFVWSCCRSTMWLADRRESRSWASESGKQVAVHQRDAEKRGSPGEVRATIARRPPSPGCARTRSDGCPATGRLTGRDPQHVTETATVVNQASLPLVDLAVAGADARSTTLPAPSGPCPQTWSMLSSLADAAGFHQQKPQQPVSVGVQCHEVTSRLTSARFLVELDAVYAQP